MVEGARLESVYTGNRIASSNLAVSAKYFKTQLNAGFFIAQTSQALLERSDGHKKQRHCVAVFKILEASPNKDVRSKSHY